MAPPREWNSNA